MTHFCLIIGKSENVSYEKIVHILLSKKLDEVYFSFGNIFLGVSHHDDLQYLFFMKYFFPYFESDAPEIPMVELYTTMWTNFAATGEPIPRNDSKFGGITWNTFVPAQTNFLDINIHPTMKNNFFPERMRMWERLFPLPSGSHNVKH